MDQNNYPAVSVSTWNIFKCQIILWMKSKKWLIKSDYPVSQIHKIWNESE